MSNIISFRKTVLGKESLSMSNQGTDCFLDLLIIAADDFEKTGNQEKLVSFLKKPERNQHYLAWNGFF